MLKLLKVLHHTQQIGTLSCYGDITRFRPDPSYVEAAGIPVLTQQLIGDSDQDTRVILQSASDARLSAQGRLPLYFEHLLPEGPNAERLARDRGCASDDQFELLAAAGHDLMGAVEVVPLPMDELTDEILSWHATLGLDHADLQIVDEPMEDGFSLGGVQTKFSMVKEGHRYALRKHTEAGSVIAKLPSTKHPDLVENEFTCLALIAAIGQSTAQVDICKVTELDVPVELPFEHYLWVLRFDRTAEGQRTHMEEFAQIAGVRPKNKYGNLDTYTKVLSILRRFSDRGVADVEDCIKRQIAFALQGNTDAHLKNWAIRYTGPSSFKLAPVYDAVSVSSFFERNPKDYGVNRAIDQRMHNDWNGDYFEEVARQAGVAKPAVARKWVRETVEACRDIWPRRLQDLPCPPGLAEHITGRLKSLGDSLLVAT